MGADDDAPSVARGTFLGLRADVVTIASALLVSVVVARALGPTHRGVYFLAVLVGNLIALFGDLGLTTAGLVFGANRRVTPSRVHGLALVFALAAGTVGTALLIGLASFWNRTVLAGLDRTTLALVGVGIAPLLFAQIAGGLLTGMGRIAELSLVRVVVAVALLALTSAAVVTTHSASWGVAAWLATNVGWALAVGALLLRAGHRPSLGRQDARTLLGFGIRGHLGTIAQHGVLRLDVLFVSARLGPRAVGIYSLASVLAERISALGHPVYAASARRMGGEGAEDAAALCARVVRVLLVVLVPAALLLAAIAGPLIRAIYGDRFGGAVTPFRLLLPGTVCLTLWAVLSLYVISALRRPGTTTLIQGGALLVAAPLYLVAVRTHGITGAAAVSSAIYVAVGAAGAAMLLRTSSVRASDLLPGPADVRALRTLLPRRG